MSIKMCHSLDTSGAAARRQRLRHVFPKTQTRIRADQHGAERGFALTRLAKSSLIRHAVAVAFSCCFLGCFVYCKISFAVSFFCVAWALRHCSAIIFSISKLCSNHVPLLFQICPNHTQLCSCLFIRLCLRCVLFTTRKSVASADKS